MKKRPWILPLLAALLLMGGGCATSGAVFEQTVEMPADAPAYDWVESEAGAPPAAGRAESGSAWGSELPTERMVIRTANLNLIVPDTNAALDEIQTMAERLGGYVVSLSTYQYDQGVRGSVSLRVPTESFNLALDRLRDMATTVRSESISGQDVTQEYVDLDSSLRHLRAVEERLLEFLANAEDTEATLAVYSELSRTQAEIERTVGRMQYLQNQVALATIDVSLTPDALAQPLDVGGWNLPGTVRSAIEGLLGVIEFFVKATIYVVIVVLPAVTLFALPVVALVLVARALVRRSRVRKAPKNVTAQPSL